MQPPLPLPWERAAGLGEPVLPASLQGGGVRGCDDSSLAPFIGRSPSPFSPHSLRSQGSKPSPHGREDAVMMDGEGVLIRSFSRRRRPRTAITNVRRVALDARLHGHERRVSARPNHSSRRSSPG